MIEEPKLTRLEYLTPKGWFLGAQCQALLHPERYVERLTANGKYGRATILNERLEPTDEVYVSPGWEDVDLSKLVPTKTPIPKLATACPLCNEDHKGPYDGSCLL